MADSAFSYIDSSSQIAELTSRVREASEVALDTEADSLHHYFEKVCLIQISLGEESYILDPLAQIDLDPLLAELAGKTLLLHGGDYDLRMLRLSFGFELRGELFDTMLAAQMLGHQELGLAAQVSRFFNIELPKHGQKADWSQRPLPAKLLDYAVGDTLYLTSLARLLREELQRLGREEWHREACRQVVRVAAQDNNRRDPATEWRIKGSNRLNPASLVILRATWKWRDAEARRADIPPFKVLSNQGLIDLAVWGEKNPEARLEKWPGLPKRYHGRRFANLKTALQKARDASLGEILETEKEIDRPLNGREDKGLVEALRLRRDALAASLELDPAILAPRAVLSAISRSKPRRVEDFGEIERMFSWQIELLAAEFIEAIQEFEDSTR